MPLEPFYQKILEQIDKLPDSAAIPLPVAELIEGVSRKTIKRIYRTVQISEHREGVVLGDMRRRRQTVTA